MNKKNEGKCCDAVLRVLECQFDAKRADLHAPDKGDRTNQRADVCVALGKKRYVLEHTRIEPFEEAIATGMFLDDFMKPIKVGLSGPLPGRAIYSLLLPQDPRLSPDMKDHKHAVQAELAAFVSAEARLLHQQALTVRVGKFVQTEREIPALGYPAVLQCASLGGPSETESGVFGAVRIVDPSLEEQRFRRISRALAEKCPKLQRSKERGARTVLVLESNDIALSNSGVIRETLDRIPKEPVSEPDEIYLVETDYEQWAVFPMNLAADALFRSDPEPDRRYFHEFASSGLANVTRDALGPEECEFCLIP